MKRKRLTKRMIDAISCRPGEEKKVWDADVIGLFLRCRGNSKSWYLQYGLGARGRNDRVLIGPHGSPWTVDTARNEARKMLGDVAKGDDPAIARRRRVKKTFGEWASEYLGHAEQTKGKRTVYEERSLLGLLLPSKRKVTDPRRKRNILERLGEIPLDLITSEDIERLKMEWVDTPTRANRALALASAMLSMAIKLGHRKNPINPVKGVARYKEEQRKNRSTGESVYLTQGEMERLGVALTASEKNGRSSPHALGAIRALALSGARASEILGLKWRDLETSVAGIPASKTGPRDLHLCPEARAVLSQLPRLEGNDFVVAGRVSGRSLTLSGLEGVWDRVRTQAGLESVHLHDLRHTFASEVVKTSRSLLITRDILGHKDVATTQRYAHVDSDGLEGAAKEAGESVAASMNSRQGGEDSPQSH